MIKLGKIMRKRHRLILVGMVLMALFLVFDNVSTVTGYYRYKQHYLMTEAQYNKPKTREQKQDKDYYEENYEEGRSDADKGGSYQQYRNDALAIYGSENASQEAEPVQKESWKAPLPAPPLGLELTTSPGWLLTAFVIGILVMSLDALGGMDRFLFTLGTSRRKVYWSKILWVGGPLVLSSLFLVGATLAGYYLMIPASHIHLTGIGVTAILLQNTIIPLGAYVTGLTMGLLIGKPLALGAAGIMALFVGMQGSANLTQLIELLRHQETIYGANIIHPGPYFWLFIIIFAVVILVFSFVDSYVYQHKSMENSNLLFTMPALRWPFLIFLGCLASILFAVLDASGNLSWLTASYLIGAVVIGLIWQYWSQLTAVWREKIGPRLGRVLRI